MKEEKEVTDDTFDVVNPVIMCLKFCTIKAKQNCRHEVFIEQKKKKWTKLLEIVQHHF